MDIGNDFHDKFREMIIDNYGIMVKPITSRDPLANVVLENFHQTIGNILHTFKVQNMALKYTIPCMRCKIVIYTTRCDISQHIVPHLHVGEILCIRTIHSTIPD